MGSAQRLTRSPSAASSAGSIVHAVTSVQATTSTAPIAIPRNIGDFTTNSENSEIITIVPEKRIVRPLVRHGDADRVRYGVGLSRRRGRDQLLAEAAS